MNKQIRLTESDLHNIIKESVKRIISESKKNCDKLGKRYGKLDGEDVQECGLDKNGNPCYIGSNPNKGRKTKKGYKFASYGDFKPNSVKESTLRRPLQENYYRREDGKVLMIGDILQGEDANEDFAMEYLQNMDFSDSEYYWENMPRYHDYIASNGGVDMYYDYGADYYFFVADEDLYQDLESRGYLEDIEEY